jgi:iron(III) transport system permease protein
MRATMLLQARARVLHSTRAIALNERAPLFLAAALVPLVVVFLLAIIFWASLTDREQGTRATLTLAHYQAIYADPFTYTAIVNTLLLATVTVVVALLFGLPIAWLAERTDLPYKPVLFALMVLGLIVPNFFVAMGWVLLLHPRMGFINTWLARSTSSPDFVINIATVPGMGFVLGLALAPLAFIMTAAAFRAMAPHLEDAAYVHGMGRLPTVLHITIPLLLPNVLAAAIYIFVIGIAAFDIPAVIGLGNRIYTFSTFVYVKALRPEGAPLYGIPAAVGMLMFLVALLLTWWYSKVLRASYNYEIVTGRSYQVSRASIGRWSIVGWAFCGLYLALSAGVPLLLVCWAALTPYLQPPSWAALSTVSLAQFSKLPWDLIARGAVNTVLLMLLVPTVTLALSIPVAWVIVRSGSRWRYVYEFLVFLPHAMPAIILGVAALLAALFILGDAVPIYGTTWLIAIAYVVVLSTFASRVVNGALIQIHRELEEAGYVSGLSILTVLRTVILPLLLPAVANAWLWMVLLTYRELTVATVLYSSANITLPVVIWNLWTAGGMAPAAAMTIIMIGILGPLVLGYWLLTGRRYAGW